MQLFAESDDTRFCVNKIFPPSLKLVNEIIPLNFMFSICVLRLRKAGPFCLSEADFQTMALRTYLQERTGLEYFSAHTGLMQGHLMKIRYVLRSLICNSIF
jgi:hypothetical protein